MTKLRNMIPLASEYLFSGFSASLADATEIDSGWLDMTEYDKYQFEGISNVGGMTLIITSSRIDGGGAPDDIVTTSPILNTFHLFNVIARGRFMNFKWRNNTGVAITNCSLSIKAFRGASDKLSVFPLDTEPTNFSQAALVQAVNKGQQPDGDYVNTPADGEIFNTTTPLGIGGVYTSPWFDVDGFGTVEFFFTTNVPSKNKGIVIQWTDDTQAGPPIIRAEEAYEFNSADIRRGYKVMHIRPKLDGFRIIYNNDGLAQSTFYLNATARVIPEVGFENSGNSIVTAEFSREVALGNISNYSQNTKFGRNNDVDTAQAADVWGGGRAALGIYDYTGHNATVNENISTVSTLAADTGTLVVSGTITAEGNNKVIDSGATFITNSVAVGDIVLNDSVGIYGYVESIDSETEITVFKMTDTSIGAYENIVGNTYRIARAASTGAAVVAWKRILNANLERQTTVFVILNGITPVVSTVDAYRCSRGKILLAGSGGENAGEITVTQAVTTANVFCIMPVSANQTLIAADTVPKDSIYLIESIIAGMSISGGTAASAVVSLRIRPKGGVFNTERIYDLSSQGGSVSDDELGGIPLEEGTDFKLRIDSVSSNNARVSGKIEYLEIDEK